MTQTLWWHLLLAACHGQRVGMRLKGYERLPARLGCDVNLSEPSPPHTLASL